MQNFNLNIVPEVTDGRFKMINDGSTELETSELLYAFVRRLKPISVLETGCYKGISSLYMAQALKDNGFGHLETLEIDAGHIQTAQELWNKYQLRDWVTATRIESLKFEPTKQYQFMFLDTELNLRFHELVKFFPNLDEGGYIFIHDMSRTLCQGNVNPDHPEIKHYPVGELPLEFNNLLKERKLVQFFFGGARGLVGYYRIHKEDYYA